MDATQHEREISPRPRGTKKKVPNSSHHGREGTQARVPGLQLREQCRVTGRCVGVWMGGWVWVWMVHPTPLGQRLSSRKHRAKAWGNEKVLRGLRAGRLGLWLPMRRGAR